MSCKNKSKIHNNRRLEFLGDGFLNYQVKKLMTARYPESMLKFMGIHFCQIVSNNHLSRFARTIGMVNGNAIEITIGRLCETNRMDEAEKMVEEIFNFYLSMRNLDMLAILNMTHVKPHVYSFDKVKNCDNFVFTSI